jgi:mannose-6-phosphate isomerase-like protein (cupin superfamily)
LLPIEYILWKDKVLAYIIRAEMLPDKTTFITPPDLNFQAGFVVYPAGTEIGRHIHRSLERQIVGTSEVLLIRKGSCIIDIYNDDREKVASVELRTGDVVLVVGGAHGFSMLEDTVFFEIKQGPYLGIDEKEHF